MDNPSSSPVLDPYAWVFGPGWLSVDDASHIAELRQRCDNASVALGSEQLARCPLIVGALRVFAESAASIAKTYRKTDVTLLREVCHAIFGWDILLSLAANPTQSRRFLLLGETGVGKERMSKLIGRTVRALYGGAQRGGRDFHVSAATFVGDTLRSELFGHVAGAFTGARVAHRGILGEMEDGDYLFIDEIGEASLPMQKMLLRTLQEHTYRPVGEVKELPKRFHLIAATNRDEQALRSDGAFRSDLYYRLASPQIRLPSLREILRVAHSPKLIFKELVDQVLADDLSNQELIGPLRVHFLGRYLAKATATTGYRWPGNFRELRNVIKQLIYTGSGATQEQTTAVIRRLKGGQPERPAELELSEPVQLPKTLAELKRGAYADACARHSTVTAVARELDVSRQTAHERIKAYELTLLSR